MMTETYSFLVCLNEAVMRQQPNLSITKSRLLKERAMQEHRNTEKNISVLQITRDNKNNLGIFFLIFA